MTSRKQSKSLKLTSQIFYHSIQIKDILESRAIINCLAQNIKKKTFNQMIFQCFKEWRSSQPSEFRKLEVEYSENRNDEAQEEDFHFLIQHFLYFYILYLVAIFCVLNELQMEKIQITQNAINSLDSDEEVYGDLTEKIKHMKSKLTYYKNSQEQFITHAKDLILQFIGLAFDVKDSSLETSIDKIQKDFFESNFYIVQKSLIFARSCRKRRSK